MAEAGVRRIVLYGTRHTRVTLGLEAGERPDVIASITGHSVATLLQHYAHVSPDAQREASERIASILDGEG